MESFADLLIEETRSFCSLDGRQVLLLTQHWEMLQRWNRQLNLTTIANVRAAVQRHYAESLFFASRLTLTPEVQTVADVGSGAGFPGFPLAVLFPELQVTLIESHQRKSVFLRECSRTMSNVTVDASRFETLTAKWDLIVSRAVSWASLETHAIRCSGKFGLLAGANSLSELQASDRVVWERPIPVPAGGRGFVLIGSSFT